MRYGSTEEPRKRPRINCLIDAEELDWKFQRRPIRVVAALFSAFSWALCSSTEEPRKGCGVPAPRAHRWNRKRPRALSMSLRPNRQGTGCFPPSDRTEALLTRMLGWCLDESWRERAYTPPVSYTHLTLPTNRE